MHTLLEAVIAGDSGGVSFSPGLEGYIDSVAYSACFSDRNIYGISRFLDFPVNVLSLLGLVLAIGLVVDDAIVVVEAVMHNIEHGMPPKEATSKAMKEVGGPVVAIAVILSAVFVPVAFTGGITGRLYQQFAITIAISVLLLSI